MELKSFFAQDASGNILPGAACYLYQPGTDIPAAGVQDASGEPLSNPFPAGVDGLVQFAAPNGSYDLRVASGQRDSRIRVQCLDVGEQVASAQAEADRAADLAILAGAALGSSNTFEDIAAGLAGTSSGQYFSVPSAEDAEYLALYKNNEGVADDTLKRYPSTNAISAIQEIVSEESGEEFVLMDELGHVVMRIGEDGRATFPALGTNGFAADESGAVAERIALNGGERLGHAESSAHEVADESGRCAASVDSYGRARLADAIIERQFRGDWDRKSGNFDYEINHIIWYGQSWSLGFDSIPAITTTQRHNTLMFNGGIRQLYSVSDIPTALQSFVPAVEATSAGTPEFGNSLGETGACACAHLIMDLIERENNIRNDQQSYQLLLSAPGEGSKTIEALSDDAQPYIQRVYEQIERGYAIAQASGKTYAVQAVAWMQGANAASGAGYAEQLEALRVKISEHAKSVTGQSHEVVLITWQLMPQSNTPGNQNSAGQVYQRFVVAADTYPHVICSGPAHQVEMISGTNVHMRPQWSAEIGRAIGLAYKRAVIDGVGYEPMRPQSLRRQGRIATLRVNSGDGFIVRDTDRVAAIANDGFNLYDSAGVGLTISSVEITGRDTLKITSAVDIPAGAILRYANIGSDFSSSKKWRGTIRDNSHISAGVNRWLVAFSMQFNN